MMYKDKSVLFSDMVSARFHSNITHSFFLIDIVMAI